MFVVFFKNEDGAANLDISWAKGWRGGEVSDAAAQRGRRRSAAKGPRSLHGNEGPDRFSGEEAEKSPE